MPVVTDYLFQLIAKQVEDKGLVVWYDPEQAYGEAAGELTIPNTTIARYDGSFFKLRKEIDHLLNDSQPPRLVVYVPLEKTDTNSALIELDCAGAIMQPRQQPPPCNTRLSVVARNALKPILGEDQVVEIERQVEARKLSLADLNSLAEKGKDISTGVLALIFGTANPQEVALEFLNSDKYDEEVKKKEADKELRKLFEISFDIELPASASLSNWRARLAQHVLLTDLVSAFKKNVPSSLDSFSVAQKSGTIEACVHLARNWRNNRDVRDSYVTAANKVEKDRGINKLSLPAELLKESETFLGVEKKLLQYVESELLKKATPATRKLGTTGADVERLYRQIRNLGRSFLSGKPSTPRNQRSTGRYETEAKASTAESLAPLARPSPDLNSACWNRVDLYNEVWNQPLVKLSRKYGISDVRLGKVCRKLKIPHPGRGYWAKKKAGTTLEQMPLPEYKDAPVVRRTKTKLSRTKERPQFSRGSQERVTGLPEGSSIRVRLSTR